jgi:hypothetical protein
MKDISVGEIVPREHKETSEKIKERHVVHHESTDSVEKKQGAAALGGIY